MYNFFDRHKFVDLCEDDQAEGGDSENNPQVQIRLACFSKVSRLLSSEENSSTAGEDNVVRLNCDYRCVLSTSDSRLLLCQIDCCQDGEEDPKPAGFRVKKLWIPLDESKGELVAMCFDRSATHLLAVTSRSLIYQIPFKFTQRSCPLYGVERIFHDEEAVVIESLTLTNPTAIAWWERETIKQNSIAIVANQKGRIAFLDLSSPYHTEFRYFSVPDSIVDLKLFDEMYYRSLLIDCGNNRQYQMMLEAFRSYQNYPSPIPSSSSDTATPSGSFSLASLSSSMSYLNCVLETPVKSLKRKRSWLSLKRLSKEQNDEDESEQNSAERGLRPQRIRFNQDILLPPPQVSKSLKETTTESSSLDEDSHDVYTLFPQQFNILVVKHNRETFRMQTDSEVETSTTDTDSNKSIDSREFCQISLSHDYLLDIYEFLAQDFCSHSILLSTSKLFSVDVTSHTVGTKSPSQLIRVIDFGYRFFLLQFGRKCVLVSKNFAEQKQNSSGPNSPRSALLLKKSDSNRGSFRNKNRKNAQASSSSMSIIETFAFPLNEERVEEEGEDGLDIIAAFPVNINPSKLTNVRFTDEELLRLTKCFSAHSYGSFALSEVIEGDGIIDRSEVSAIELLLSHKMTNLVEIKETLLVVTPREVFLIEPKFNMFGNLFHAEISAIMESLFQQELANTEDARDHCLDGDIVTRAKFLVDCFISRSLVNRGSKSSPGQQFQSWQSWLTRSALILLKQLSQQIDAAQLDRRESIRLNQVLTLFELARTSRRRVIAALNYFQFWSQAINFNRKFFTTKTVLELGDEERLFLAHQMFQSLIDKFCHQAEHEHDSELSQQTQLELFQYYRTYLRHYDCRLLVARLLDLKLWKMASYVAKANGDCVLLLHMIIQKYGENRWCRESRQSRLSILNMLTQPNTIDWLVYSADYYCGHRSSIRLIEQYLNCFVLKQLAHLSSKYLLRLARLFDPFGDPRRPAIGWLLDVVLNVCNQTYLREMHEHNNQPKRQEEYECVQPIKRRHILNLYIFVLLLCIRKIVAKKKLALNLYYPNYGQDVDDFIGKEDQNQIEDRKTEAETIAAVSCGGSYSCAFKHDRLYVWGQFPYYNLTFHEYHQYDTLNTQQILSSSEWSARSIQNLRSPMLITFFSHTLDGTVNIKCVASGYKHIVILSECGLLFALGCSTFGQLGLGKDVLMTRYPLLVKITNQKHDRIVKVSCGSYHSFALSQLGRLYSWGWALHGQLGHGEIEDEWTPKLVEFFIQENITLVDVAGGYYHSIALSNQGEVYVFGENSYGQLGLDVETTFGALNKVRVPQLLTKLSELASIRLIGCGLFHSVAVGRDGGEDDQVYCWGVDPKSFRNKMRAEKAMLRSKQNEDSGDQMPADDSISSLSSSSKIRVITRKPVEPQPSHDFEEIKLEDFLYKLNTSEVDKRTEEETNIRFVKVVAGQCHTLLLSEKGRVYVFGMGREGQLGLGSSCQSACNQFVCIDSLANIQDIGAGAMHSVVIDRNQRVWSFGHNADHALGIIKHKSSQASTPSSESRRNSLLNNLMQNTSKKATGQEQVVSRIMSLHKNVEWSPVEVEFDFHFEASPKNKSLLKTTTKQEALATTFDWLAIEEDEEDGFIYRHPHVIEAKLTEALICYRKELDHRALIKRLDNFNLPSLSALVFYTIDDLSSTFSNHLKALQAEIQACLLQAHDDWASLETAWCDQLYNTLAHFVRKSDQLEQQSIIAQLLLHLKQFFSFYQECVPETSQAFNMTTIVNKLCLQTNPMCPFFVFETLALMKQQEQEETIANASSKIIFSNEQMFQLFECLELSIRQLPSSKLPKLQALANSLVDNSAYQCANVADGDSVSDVSLLEQNWKRILNRFVPNGDLNNNSNDDNARNVIELEIPGFASEQVVIIFRCAHHVFIDELRRLVDGDELRQAHLSQFYQRLIESGGDDDKAVQEHQLDCPQCAVTKNGSGVAASS